MVICKKSFCAALFCQYTTWHLRKQKKYDLQKKGITLDGFLLLELANKTQPEMVTEIFAESCDITNVVSVDFSYFVNLKTANFNDNNVPILPLMAFQNLNTLYLNCNGIADIPVLTQQNTIPNNSNIQNILPPLQILSLSHNAIQSDSLINLNVFSNTLIELNLSSNSINSLPRGFSHLMTLKKCSKNIIATL